MTIKRPILYIILIVVALGIILLFLKISKKSPDVSQFDQKARTTPSQYTNKSNVHLYFADKENSFLIAEERTLFYPDDPAEFGKIIIESLIKGPQEGLMRTIPASTTLKALYVTNDGTAYVDISNEARENHPGGAKTELLTIYSIVNSLILNIPEIAAVKILIEGNESMTMAGHIDLRFPFKANMLLIR